MTWPNDKQDPAPAMPATANPDPREPRELWFAGTTRLYEPRVVAWIARVRDALPPPDDDGPRSR